MIGAIYYINLEHRKDRRASIEQQISTFLGDNPNGVHVQRIEAIHVPGFGILGCGRSHILALQTFLASEHETCIIFEDDFVFSLPAEQCRSMFESFFSQSRIAEKQWDVVMVASNTKSAEQYNELLDKCIDAQTASGYMIHRSFAPTLLANLLEGSALLESTHNINLFANDIYWKHLQPHSQWFIFRPKMGLQGESYSDIEHRNVNYGV